eukprot:8246103-Alexandrium_andersonii.AAC.1
MAGIKRPRLSHRNALPLASSGLWLHLARHAERGGEFGRSNPTRPAARSAEGCMMHCAGGLFAKSRWGGGSVKRAARAILCVRNDAGEREVSASRVMRESCLCCALLASPSSSRASGCGVEGANQAAASCCA